MPSANLKDKVALVTGASRGIGAAVAKALAREGAHVLLLGRTEGALEEVNDTIQSAGGQATIVPLDLKDGKGIDRLGAAIAERWGCLDILVGNAGILGPLSPVGHIRPKDWDDLLAVNLTANWRLLRSLDSLLKAAPAGRAVFVTSGAATKCRPFWAGYAVTKAGLECLVKTYAAETEKMPLRVNMINPGPLRTGMRAQAMPGEDPETLRTPDDIAPLFVEYCKEDISQTGQIINFADR